MFVFCKVTFLPDEHSGQTCDITTQGYSTTLAGFLGLNTTAASNMETDETTLPVFTAPAAFNQNVAQLQ